MISETSRWLQWAGHVVRELRLRLQDKPRMRWVKIRTFKRMPFSLGSGIGRLGARLRPCFAVDKEIRWKRRSTLSPVVPAAVSKFPEQYGAVRPTSALGRFFSVPYSWRTGAALRFELLTLRSRNEFIRSWHQKSCSMLKIYLSKIKKFHFQ